MTTKLGRQVHLEEFTQTSLIKQVLVTSSRQDYVANVKFISTTKVPRPANLIGC